MAYCSHCGTQFTNNAVFCSKCGVKFNATPPVCRHCSREYPEGAMFCEGCGQKLENGAPAANHTIQPAHGYYYQPAPPPDSKSLFEHYCGAWKKYGVFNGRARRREFWGFQLFDTIFTFILAIIDLVTETGIFVLVYNLASAIPTLAVSCRRMHDTGRSGWWILLPIVNLIFWIQNGTYGNNAHGPDPKHNA